MKRSIGPPCRNSRVKFPNEAMDSDQPEIRVSPILRPDLGTRWFSDVESGSAVSPGMSSDFHVMSPDTCCPLLFPAAG